ncbi:Concanavalin A-like lectin/glucanases superfamily [Diplonema papillatum]|nr:Concanavalin A-like lectin/glucanases superfamily [Diplonema papillatum]
MSIYAKCKQAAGKRMLIHVGGETHLAGVGIGIQYVDDSDLTLFVDLFNRSDGHEALITNAVVDFNWHHYATTYDGKTLIVYVDEVEVHREDVALRLVASDLYAKMSIGESHGGGTKYHRGGEWLFDEAVFASGVAMFCELRASCGQCATFVPPTAVPSVFSRYSFNDGNLVDEGSAGNNNPYMFTPNSDTICGGSLLVKETIFHSFGTNDVPLGSDPWTMSIYAKCKQAEGKRMLIHVGGETHLAGVGIGIQYVDDSDLTLFVDFFNRSDGHEALITNAVVDFDWHHYATTYDGKTLIVYVDEVEVHREDVVLSLVASDLYGKMSIGESHGGGTKYHRGGAWLFDEAVFASGVVMFCELRAPCAKCGTSPTAVHPTSVFSRYSFNDGNLIDEGSAGNNNPYMFTPNSDAICGGSLLVKDTIFHSFGTNDVPLGSDPWTMSIYAKCKQAEGKRMLIHVGGESHLAGVGIGIQYVDDSDLTLFVDFFNRSDGHEALITNAVVDFNWHHYATTYDGKTLIVYVDEVEVHREDVALRLVASDLYGKMSIGESHGGGTKYHRGGAWLFDEAVFASGVAIFCELRASCGQCATFVPPTAVPSVFSRYSFNDGNLLDEGSAGNNNPYMFTPKSDAICGGSLLVKDTIFHSFGTNDVPLGSDPWTMSIYAKCKQAEGKRMLIHVGGETHLAGVGIGIQYVDDSDLTLFVDFFNRSDGHEALITNAVVDFDWHHYATTYDGKTLIVYVDEVEVHREDVALSLVASDLYGKMSIGESHGGGTKYHRGGEWLFDEAVFASGVVMFCELRASCARCAAFVPPTAVPSVFSRYSFNDGNLIDEGSAGNNNPYVFVPSFDTICGGSLLVQETKFCSFGTNDVPLGSDPWTMSIYAKCKQAGGKRMLIHVGGETHLAGVGIGIQYIDESDLTLFIDFFNRSDGHEALITNAVVDFDWHHYATIYDGKTLIVYVDEVEVHREDVALGLVASDLYGKMSIGESHGGGTKYHRGGEWLFDEAVFASGVVRFCELRASCARCATSPTAVHPTSVFSRYSFNDGNLIDEGSAGNNNPHVFTPNSDTICGGSLLVKETIFHSFGTNDVPLGSDPWTMSIYAKCKQAGGKRMLIHVGGETHLAGVGIGIQYVDDSDLTLFVDFFNRSDGHEALITNAVVDFDWHHYATTYDGKTLIVYVDEVEVHREDVALRLVASDLYGKMSIGESHGGGTKYHRGGEWLFDEAVFASSVVMFCELRASCVKSATFGPPTAVPRKVATFAPLTTAVHPTSAIATAWVVTGPLGFKGTDTVLQVSFTTDQGTVCLSEAVMTAPAASSTVVFTVSCAHRSTETITRVEILTQGVVLWDVTSIEFEQKPSGILHQWLSETWGSRNGGPLGGSRAAVVLLPPSAFSKLFDVTFRVMTSGVLNSASLSGLDLTFYSRNQTCGGGWLSKSAAGRTHTITVKCPFETGTVDRVDVAASEWDIGAESWTVISAQLLLSHRSWKKLTVDGTHPPFSRMIKKLTMSHTTAVFLVPFSVRIYPSRRQPLELRMDTPEAPAVAVRFLSTAGGVCTVQVPIADITDRSIVETPACLFRSWDISEIAVVATAVWSWGLARVQSSGAHTGHQWETYVSPLFGWSAMTEIAAGVPSVIPFYASAPKNGR